MTEVLMLENRTDGRTKRPQSRLGLGVVAGLLLLIGASAARADAPEWQTESGSSADDPDEIDAREHARREQLQMRGADEDLAYWRSELVKVQRQARAYLGLWTVGQAALTGVNVYVATSTDSDARRAGYSIATALSGANLLYLWIQGWPALRSVRRFDRMRSGTLSEKIERATYAQNVIAAQANKDRMETTVERHIGAGVVAAAAGLSIGLAYGDLYESLSLGVGVLGVAELVMLTRPGRYHAPIEVGHIRGIQVAPWADRFVRGVAVQAQF